MPQIGLKMRHRQWPTVGTLSTCGYLGEEDVAGLGVGLEGSLLGLALIQRTACHLARLRITESRWHQILSRDREREKRASVIYARDMENGLASFVRVI